MDASNFANALHTLFRELLPQQQPQSGQHNQQASPNSHDIPTSVGNAERLDLDVEMAASGVSDAPEVQAQPSSINHNPTTDDGAYSSMPELEEVSDSSDSSSDSHSSADANEVEMQAVDDGNDSAWTHEEDGSSSQSRSHSNARQSTRPGLHFSHGTSIFQDPHDDDPDMPPLEPIISINPVAPSRAYMSQRSNNRRARVEDDHDDERDRRHPFERIRGSPGVDGSQQPRNNDAQDPRAFHFIPQPGPGAQTPNPADNVTRIPNPLLNNSSGEALGGFAISFDLLRGGPPTVRPIPPGFNPRHVAPPSQSNAIPSSPSVGATNPNSQATNTLNGNQFHVHLPVGVDSNFSFTEILTRLRNLGTFGIDFGLGFGDFGPEQDDPEKGCQLVEGMEEVPRGLVKRLERLESVNSEEDDGIGMNGGDGVCAICWERLLGDGGFGDEGDKITAHDSVTESSSPVEVSSSSSTSTSGALGTAPSTNAPNIMPECKPKLPKIVSLPCAHVFHSSCLIPWFSTPRRTTCPTCRFNVDPEDIIWGTRRPRGMGQPIFVPLSQTSGPTQPAPVVTAGGATAAPSAATTSRATGVPNAAVRTQGAGVAVPVVGIPLGGLHPMFAGMNMRPIYVGIPPNGPTENLQQPRGLAQHDVNLPQSHTVPSQSPIPDQTAATASNITSGSPETAQPSTVNNSNENDQEIHTHVLHHPALGDIEVMSFSLRVPVGALNGGQAMPQTNQPVLTSATSNAQQQTFTTSGPSLNANTFTSAPLNNAAQTFSTAPVPLSIQPNVTAETFDFFGPAADQNAGVFMDFGMDLDQGMTRAGNGHGPSPMNNSTNAGTLTENVGDNQPSGNGAQQAPIDQHNLAQLFQEMLAHPINVTVQAPPPLQGQTSQPPQPTVENMTDTAYYAIPLQEITSVVSQLVGRVITSMFTPPNTQGSRAGAPTRGELPQNQAPQPMEGSGVSTSAQSQVPTSPELQAQAQLLPSPQFRPYAQAAAIGLPAGVPAQLAQMFSGFVAPQPAPSDSTPTPANVPRTGPIVPSPSQPDMGSVGLNVPLMGQAGLPFGGTLPPLRIPTNTPPGAAPTQPDVGSAGLTAPLMGQPGMPFGGTLPPIHVPTNIPLMHIPANFFSSRPSPDPNRGNPSPAQRQNSQQEKKKWLPPAPPGLTLRQRVEKRERDAGLRCYDVSCGVGPSDDDPLISSSSPAIKQLSIRLMKNRATAVGTTVCTHTFHPACLVSAERVALQGAEEKVDGGDVEVSCPVCRGVGYIGKEEWDEGVQALV